MQEPQRHKQRRKEKEVEEVRGKEKRCEKIMKNRRSGQIVGALKKKREGMKSLK